MFKYPEPASEGSAEQPHLNFHQTSGPHRLMLFRMNSRHVGLSIKAALYTAALSEKQPAPFYMVCFSDTAYRAQSHHEVTGLPF
jgi:hypothetical protein